MLLRPSVVVHGVIIAAVVCEEAVLVSASFVVSAVFGTLAEE